VATHPLQMQQQNRDFRQRCDCKLWTVPANVRLRINSTCGAPSKISNRLNLTLHVIWNQLNQDFNILPSVASFTFNYKKSFWYLYIKLIGLLVGLRCMVTFIMVDWVIISAVKLFHWKRGVVIYGANARSLLPVVLFIPFINVHAWFFIVCYKG